MWLDIKYIMARISGLFRGFVAKPVGGGAANREATDSGMVQMVLPHCAF